MNKNRFFLALASLVIIFLVAQLSLNSGDQMSVAANTPSPTVLPTPTPSVTPTPTPTLAPLPTATPTPMEEPKLVRIEAVYGGPAVEVGEKYNKDDVRVIAVYSDNTTEPLEHYIISGEVVELPGNNTFVVIYNRLTTEFVVKGKAIESISALALTDTFGIGNMPDTRDIYLAGVYSDGTVERIMSGFEIAPEVISSTGTQTIQIIYKGLVTTCKVVGVERPELSSLSVSSEITTLPAGLELDRDDLTVIAVYTDGKAERITTYELSKTKFEEVGSHVVKVYYAGRSAEFKVEVVERNPKSMWANYTGGKVMVGRNFLKSMMHVYVVYEDGEEKEVDDYTYHTARVRYIGENQMELYYGSTLSTTVLIEGTAIEKPSFDYTSTVSATNGKQKLTIETAIPVYLEQDAVVSRSIKKIVMKKAFKKVGVSKGEYIAFTYDFANIDDEIELPLDVRITIPDEFDMAHTFLYYTPNRKTILGRTNKTPISDNVFETTIFKTGTYMLVYSEEFDKELGADELSEETESDYID